MLSNQHSFFVQFFVTFCYVLMLVVEVVLWEMVRVIVIFL